MLGALTVHAIQLSFATRAPSADTSAPDVPPEFVFGLGFAGVATGELFNGDLARGNGLSLGAVLTASFTPAGL